MKLYNEEIVELLNKHFTESEQYVESINLASYCFTIQFIDLAIQCEERVFATIGGQSYVWDGAPSFAPWGVLGLQSAKRAVLESSSLLKIQFETGDHVKIETCENQYESVVFDFGSRDGSLLLEIF